MTTPTHHPVLKAVNDFMPLARRCMGFRFPYERNMLDRSGDSAMRAIAIAATGVRRKYHLGRASEAVLRMRAIFHVLWIRNAIEFGECDEIYRRLDQILDGLARLEKADKQAWSEVELPPLAPPSAIELPVKRNGPKGVN
jgi:hypothetical protein